VKQQQQQQQVKQGLQWEAQAEVRPQHQRRVSHPLMRQHSPAPGLLSTPAATPQQCCRLCSRAWCTSRCC
jgi:hypothetical protein